MEIENIHAAYSEMALESQRNRELYLREVKMHNLTLGNKHRRIVALKEKVEELEQRFIKKEKSRRDLVVNYEQQIRNLDSCQELVTTLQRKLTQYEAVDN